VDYCYGGDGICPDDCMFHNDNDCDRLDPYDSSYPLVIDLITEQDTYEIEETFNGALPYLEYSGPPFEGAIIYTRYREGFVDSDAYDILYKGYLEKIDSHDLNDSMFRAGYPMQACRIYEYRTGDAPNEFFDHEGTYVYGMHVYDCLDIENEGYECESSSFDHVLKDDEWQIVANVEPIASVEKVITVSGGTSSAECWYDDECTQECTNCVSGTYKCFTGTNYPYCVECNGNSYCNDGYECEDYVCVPE